MTRLLYINSAGCTENLLDGAMMQNAALRAGYARVEDPGQADLIVYNTCAFKQAQEDYALRMIAHFESVKKPGAQLIVCGCLPEINRERLTRTFQGPIFSPTELLRFLELAGTNLGPEALEEAHAIPPELFATQRFGRAWVDRIDRFRAWATRKLGRPVLPRFNILDFVGDAQSLFLRLARGCPKACSYCAVRFAQGPLKSLPPGRVVKEIRDGVARGARHIVLTATNLSLYGQDLGTTLAGTLSQVLAIEGDFGLTLMNLEPFGLMEQAAEIAPLLAHPKIRSIYCPLNSGSQAVLAGMNRHYRLDEVIGLLGQLRADNPGLLIRTEFIAGFPGETWRDFWLTYGLIRSFRFDLIDLHSYSPRPRTAAATMNRQVPVFVRRLRWLLLQELVLRRVLLPKLRPL